MDTRKLAPALAPVNDKRADWDISKELVCDVLTGRVDLHTPQRCADALVSFVTKSKTLFGEACFNEVLGNPNLRDHLRHYPVNEEDPYRGYERDWAAEETIRLLGYAAHPDEDYEILVNSFFYPNLLLPRADRAWAWMVEVQFLKFCDCLQEQSNAGNNQDEPDLSEANQDEPDLSEYSPWKTPKEWCVLFNVKRTTLWRWRNANPPEIRVHEINSKKWMIHKDDLRKWGVLDLL